MTAILEHDQLGRITGIKRGQTVQFRGLPYGTLSHKFATATLFNNAGKLPIDATTFGPSCICHPHALNDELGFIQCSLPSDDFKHSDTKCLNLNLIKPKGNYTGLPVFVYIHGGGFALGANSWPQYDLTRIIEISVRRGTPVIGVTINYRLGAQGFLSSRELSAAGIQPNRGLRDQRLAFEWLQAYIEGFGGNPAEITVIGESSGGVSALLHAQSSIPLFQRAISMGGTPLLLKPLPPDIAEGVYATALKHLGIYGDTAEKRIEELLEKSGQDILNQIPSFLPLLPIVDEDIVSGAETFAKYTGGGVEHKWCKSILVGDCELDASVTPHMLGPGRLTGKDSVVEFERSIRNSLHQYPDIVPLLLEAYCNRQQKPSETIDGMGILEFAQDIGFYAPTITFAHNWPGNTYVYHFNASNPWDGPWKGIASHILDVAFLFQNFNDKMPDVHCEVAIALAGDFLDFVRGKEPFPRYNMLPGSARIYDEKLPGGATILPATALEKHKRRRVIFDLGQGASLDALSNAWNDFAAGKWRSNVS